MSSTDRPTGELPIPASIEAAWGVAGPQRRGPKPTLTLDRIVEAGIALADADGLGAVSMARVAKELGGSTMSLYRYVQAKDELLDLMVDGALGPVPDAVLVAGRGGWRPGLEAWTVGVLTRYRQHPWCLEVPIKGPPVAPNSVSWLDGCLRALDATPLAPAQQASVALLLSGFARNAATLEAGMHQGEAEAGATEDEIMGGYGPLLRRLADAERFPALQRVLAAGVFDQADGPDVEFTFGLERILDGVAALIAAPAR